MPVTTHAYEVGETVYHVMGEEPGIVVALSKAGEPTAPIRYTVIWSDERARSEHFEIELSASPPYPVEHGESFMDEGCE